MRTGPIVTLAILVVSCLACRAGRTIPTGDSPDACRVRATAPVSTRTASGQGVYVDGSAASAGATAIFVAGQPVLLRDSAGYGYAPGRLEGRPAAGALVRLDGSAVLVAAPPGDSALYDPLVSYRGDGNWDVVWDRARVTYQARPVVADVYHAVFDGRGWSGLERVGEIPRAGWARGLTSPLLRTESGLAFAVPVSMPPAGDSGVAVMFYRDRRWEQRLVSTGTGAGAAYAALEITGTNALVAYVTGDASAGGGINALYTRRSGDLGRTWSAPVRIVGNGVYGLSLLRIGRGALAAVWTQRSATGSRMLGEVWVSRSRDGGASWEPATRIPDTQGVDRVATGNLADGSAVVAVQRGGALTREHQLVRVTERMTTTMFRDTADAAHGPALTALGGNAFAMVWGRGDALPGGTREGVLPWLVLQRLDISCVGGTR